MQQILDTVRAFEGVLELAPAEGGEFPEAAWGDHFFYYAPDGQVPGRVQPYATVVTKDRPGDTLSGLDPAGRARLNIQAGRAAFTELIGADPGRAAAMTWDFAAADVLLPHPVHGAAGWVAVVDPGSRTTPAAVELLRAAHERARRRAARRGA